MPRRTAIILALASLALASAHASPQSAKALARQLFADPHIEQAQITPGNLGLSFLSGDGRGKALRVTDFASGRVAVARPEGSESVYDYYWIDRDSVLVFNQLRGMPTYAFAASYNLGGRVDTPLTLVYDTMPDVDNVYLAKQGRVTDKFPDLYRINAYTGSKVRTMENPGNVLLWYTDKDATPRIAYTIDADERDQFDYRAREGDPWRRLDIRGEPFGVLFLDNGETFILFIRREGEARAAAYRFDAASNRYLDTIASDPVYDIIPSRFVVDPETEEALGFHYALEKPRSHWFKPELEAAQARLDAADPGAAHRIAGYDHTGRGVVYERFSDRDPGQWRVLGLDDGSDRLLGETMPGVDPAKMRATRPVAFEARDGARIHAYLTLPDETGAAPGKALVMIHGGPRSRDHWGWDPEAQYFASLGYAVFKINYRGSEGYGTDYSPLYHLDSIESSVRDAIDGARWLEREGVAMPGAIAIYGSSFGGHVALRCAADEPELFAAAIGYAGVYDWAKEIEADLEEEPEYYALKFKTYYGDFENDKASWLAASAIARAERIRASILLIHGRSDDIVSSQQSRAMHRALRKAGADATLKLLSFNAHGLTIEAPRIEFYATLAEFLEKAMKPERRRAR